MNDDDSRQPYIINQNNGSGDLEPFLTLLLILFVVCVIGVIVTPPLNAAWAAIEPYWIAVNDWRDGVVAWFGSVWPF
ncbi:hypothetical protein PZ895_00595 [Mesorhizobium sp. YIM 152430]|uniref:hypothetical protein n=1 Tax=Mesorhizobium sp. YIM 152430 TaxID=3031761 RepID=UPI0023D99056|nr:hypothetical protein [Mesorhizobium sp. YIM 152430]MDF1598275.1 hypothetical protein [Mesorhizobium sp. YIM 152430]